MNRDLPDTPTNDIEDTPCFTITLKVSARGHTDDSAVQYLVNILDKAKAEDECEIFDWDIDNVEEA